MKLTVIIRDFSHMIHLNEPCSFRSVNVELTEEQLLKIQLRHKEEAISTCFLEE